MTVPYEMDEINEELTDNYNLEYNDTIEQLIKSKGEQCEILSKLHLMSHEEYKRKELFFNIPIITVTAIVGFVSALKIDYEYMNIVIGGCSLLVSLMKSYLSFFKISQKNENHRVAYLQYFQISNEMRIEMSLTPELRKRPSQLLNLIKVKMKNLNEVSEIIPTDIIDKFNIIFKQYPDNIKNQMTTPDVIMSLQPISINNNHVVSNASMNTKEPITV